MRAMFALMKRPAVVKHAGVFRHARSPEIPTLETANGLKLELLLATNH
jgi:hypothetical protein